MKTITFYSEKGGVGKSTFAIMYASWLQYKHGLKVAIVDFNNRIQQHRDDEIKGRLKGDPETYDCSAAWKIVTARKSKLDKEFPGVKLVNAAWLDKEVREGQLQDIDVAIIDLPGATNGQEFVDLFISRSIGEYVVIVDRDNQTYFSAITFFEVMHKMECTNYCGFFNQKQSFKSIHDYETLNVELTEHHAKMLPDVISYTERIKNLKEPSIFRSTFEFPDWTNKAFEGSGDIGIENLFIDITKELVKSKDFRNTQPTNLSFVNSLSKTFEGQEDRQLYGTVFPEYEFPVEMFSKTRTTYKPKKEDK